VREETEVVEWHSKRNTKDECISEFVFDYSSFPNAKILESSNDHFVLSLGGGSKINYDVNHNTEDYLSVLIRENNRDKVEEKAELDFHSSRLDLTSFMEYIKNEREISFSEKHPAVGITAIAVAVGIWYLDRECKARIYNKKQECKSKNLKFVKQVCGGYCVKEQ